MYDQDRNLVRMVSNDCFSAYWYKYDALGNCTSCNAERYEYNLRDELVRVASVTNGDDALFDYDDCGNRLSAENKRRRKRYSTNELNQYSIIEVDGARRRLHYDLCGNLTNVITSTGVWYLQYNAENRPYVWRRAFDGESIIIVYDHIGRRAIEDGRVHLYDEDRDISDTIWDPTITSGKQPLLMKRSDGITWLFSDAFKNVVNYMSGTNLFIVTYSPFGNPRGSTAELPGVFSSEIYNSKLGVYHYMLRDYSPKDGRWCGRDPAGEAFGPNLYRFANNSPMTNFDIWGMTCEKQNLDVSVGVSIPLGFGALSFSYTYSVSKETCDNVHCDDCTTGYTVETTTSHMGSMGGSWKAWGWLELGYSWDAGGETHELYNSCTGGTTKDGCSTLNVSVFGGPSLGIEDFLSISVKGQATFTTQKCADGSGSDNISGQIVLEQCYSRWFLSGCHSTILYPRTREN